MLFESPIEIDSNGIMLSATFCAPMKHGAFPCILMLSGGGALDRDGNDSDLRPDVCKLIAHRLVEDGFASLRYDKRGCGKSEGDYFQASYQDNVSDALACCDQLQAHGGCQTNHIYICAHGEGSLIAMQVSVDRPNLAGIVQLCPLLENIGLAQMKQAKYVKKALHELPGVKGLLLRLFMSLQGDPVTSRAKMIKRVRSNEALAPEVESKNMGLQWFREMLDVDINQLYLQVRCPTLLIAGSKDLQCDSTNAYGVRASGKTPIEIHVIDTLTHTLRFDLREPSLFHYPALILRPIEPIVLDLISAWLTKS